MVRKFLIATGGLALLGAAGFLLLTQPWPRGAEAVPDHQPDLANGETLFWAGGCASCHAPPGAKRDGKRELAGGLELKTPFGIFRAPNISPDRETGIGRWSMLDFINAMTEGISPDGRHYYPAFPYTNYRRMPLTDLVDLKVFIDTLPSVNNQVADHDLGFPFNIRRGLGLWKWRYLTAATFVADPAKPAAVERGRYLVEGPGHCGACHSPRDPFGGEIAGRALAGAVALEVPAGKDGRPGKAGKIPNLTPHRDALGGWSETDIAYALESGMDPDFDSFGGAMVAVQENMAKLSAGDRAAIAAYLKSLPALAPAK